MFHVKFSLRSSLVGSARIVRRRTLSVSFTLPLGLREGDMGGGVTELIEVYQRLSLIEFDRFIIDRI